MVPDDVGFIRRPGAALGILTGINVLNYFDRYLLSAVLPLVLADLSLSDSQGGMAQSVFVVIYSLTSPLIGSWGDRRRRLPLAAAGVFIWSLATYASGSAPSFLLFLLARALIGVGEASYAIVSPSLLSDLFAPARRGWVMAIFYAAIPVGAAAAYGLGGWLGARHGWRAAFHLAGAPGAFLALALLALKEPARGQFDAVAAAATRGWRESCRVLGRRRSYLFNTGAQVIYTFSMGGLAHWMPTYFVRERHLSLPQATTAFGITLVLAGFLGTLLGGQLGDRLAQTYRAAHFLFSGWALLASAPFTLLAILHPRPVIFWPAMFFTLFLLFLNTGPLNAAMANVLPADLRGRGFAYYTVAIHLLGDALSPALIGFFSDRIGLRLPVLLTGLLLVVSGAVLLAGRGALAQDLTRGREGVAA